MLVCLFGAVSFPHSASESQNASNNNDSISYAKQTIWDSSPLGNRNIRSRLVAATRNAKLEQALPQPLFLSTPPSPYVINLLIVESPTPQSLAIFNPTTRSPPA